MFGKALRLAPKVLLLDEPTQGIDVGAKDQIHRLIDEAAAEGMATARGVDRHRRARPALPPRDRPRQRAGLRATLVGDQITTEHIEHTQLESSRRAS